MQAMSVCLALGLALTPGALATVEADVPVTLAEALHLAVQANPELQAASARVEALAARTEAVRRSRLPRVGLSVDWSRTDQPAGVFAGKLDAGGFTTTDLASLDDPAALGHLGTSLTLEAPIDVFGKIGTRAAAMAAERDAAAAGTRDAVQETRLRVTEAYRQAEMAARAVEVTEGVLDVARAREAEIETRVETGGALAADLLRARARRREREADLAEQRARRRMALAALARLLGAPSGTSYVPTEPPPAVAPLESDDAAWLERALRQRAALESTRRRADAASAVVKHEKNGRLPDLAVLGQLRDDRAANKGNHSYAIGVALRWTPLDPSCRRREAAAVAEQRAAALEAGAASDQVRLEVALAYSRALSARERHAAATGGLEEGREALRVVQERRRAGMATLTDELEAETAALGAALQEIAAAADVANADAALRRAAGEL